MRGERIRILCRPIRIGCILDTHRLAKDAYRARKECVSVFGEYVSLMHQMCVLCQPIPIGCALDTYRLAKDTYR